MVSWLGNFVGAALFVGLMNAAGSFDHKEAFTIILANKKVHHTFGSCFVLGIFCNWLVCIATWQANAAQDMFGKVIAIWWVGFWVFNCVFVDKAAVCHVDSRELVCAWGVQGQSVGQCMRGCGTKLGLAAQCDSLCALCSYHY